MIKEIEIEGERIFLKKSDIFGWKVIYPIKIDGKINWFNLLIGGNWYRFFGMLLIIILILLVVKEYSNAVNVANECLSKQIIFP